MTFRPYSAIVTAGVGHDRTNSTGSLITKGTPLRINTSGTLDFINVSVESEAVAVSGIATNDITSGQKGTITSGGKIEDITTTASLGDLLYVSKTGGLTSVRPEIGAGGFLSGDFVIMAGVVAKNETNPVKKDIIVSMDIQGRL